MKSLKTSMQSLPAKLDQGPDINSGSVRSGTYCEQVSLSVTLTTGSLAIRVMPAENLLFYTLKDKDKWEKFLNNPDPNLLSSRHINATSKIVCQFCLDMCNYNEIRLQPCRCGLKKKLTYFKFNCNATRWCLLERHLFIDQR